MSSQPKLHSIKNQSDFTFCDIPRRKYHSTNNENENPLSFSTPIWTKNSGFNQTPSPSPMVEGRKELTETINDSTESWYDLSLNYMVTKDVDNNNPADVKDPDQLKGKKKDIKEGDISRSVSLDTGVFLLKMFVPDSFGRKKHKVSRTTSMDGLRKRQHKTWFFVENRSKTSKNNRGSTTTTTTTTKTTQNRYAEGTLKPRCWFKPTNPKGCIFF